MWTHQEFDLLETLTRRVRLLSVDQIARIPWRQVDSQRYMKRPSGPRLRRLIQAGLLARAFINVRRLKPTCPLFRWRPGDDEPNVEQLVATITTRWPVAAQPVEVYWASRYAASLFGSSAGRLPKLHHRDHDLLLADAYLHYRVHERAWAMLWRGEDSRPKAGYQIKDPDAFLVDREGRIVRVIESTGRYGVRQIEAFHDHCASENLSYELW